MRADVKRNANVQKKNVLYLGFELCVLGSELLDGLLVLGSASNGILQIVDSISGFVRLLKA